MHAIVNFVLYPQLLIQRADVNQSNDLSLAEFVNYVQEHEKRLLLVFHTLDANSDGMCSVLLLPSCNLRTNLTHTVLCSGYINLEV